MEDESRKMSSLLGKRSCSSISKMEEVGAPMERAPKRLKTLGHVNIRIGKQCRNSSSELGTTFPSFVKELNKSHLSRSFWMGIPVQFCKKNLPKEDIGVILEDEGGRVYQSQYIVGTNGLRGGWKELAINNKLKARDVVVFHLIETLKFKVYVVRDNGSNERVEHFLVPECDPAGSSSTIAPNPECSSSSFISYEEFKTAMSELLGDLEHVEEISLQYYKLCCSQNTLLHKNLRKDAGCSTFKIALRISETVRLANVLRTCSMSSLRSQFTNLDSCLTQLQSIGMNVEFLHARLNQLHSLLSESDAYSKTVRDHEACAQTTRTKIEDIEARLARLRKVSGEHAACIQTLKPKVEGIKSAFNKTVVAPW